MSTFPNSPKILKGGIVLIDPDTSAVLRTIVLQYNPDGLTRSLQAHAIGPEPGDRLEALRLKGPPAETIKLDAEIDATDQLAETQPSTTVTQYGIHPQLAVLETLIYPSSAQLQAIDQQASMGTLEIAPMQAPLAVFVWSQVRVLPVRLTDFSITEEAFDTNLNPIRAKVSLGMRVLTVDDLGFEHKGGNLFLAYLQRKEQLVGLAGGGSFSAFGITGIP
jgi:hypothetical protein